MDEHPKTQACFRNRVYECLALAEKLYDVNFGRVTITFDLKGKTAGLAIASQHPTCGYVYKLRFNKEALQLDWDGMFNSTIPHEVAHLVAFAKPSLQSTGHDRKWRSIAIKLGDINRGQIYHSMNLTPARRITKFRYQNTQGHVDVSARLHRKVQAGSCRIAADGLVFSKTDYVGIQTT